MKRKQFKGISFTVPMEKPWHERIVIKAGTLLSAEQESKVWYKKHLLTELMNLVVGVN